jgi:ribose transport system substrate-binding protein
MSKSLSILLAGLVMLAFSGCGKKIEATSTPARITIAVIPKGTTHEFWKSVHAGAAKAAKELDVDIIWKGALKEDNREAQISVVEDFISRRVSGIVLAPLDDTALCAPVASAVRNGIPVIIFDSDLKSQEIISFVATDNYLGGKLAGKRLAELLVGKGRVAMLRYQEGSASTMRREQGFLDVMKEYPGITIVSANQYGGPTTETAYQASENMLAPLKTPQGGLTIQGIFCPNESTTFGMLRALQDESLAGKIRYVGFDSSAKLVEALRLGHIDSLVLQNPMRMGYLGVKTMVDHLRSQTVEKRIDTGATLATKENVDQPEMKELLEPKL